MRKVLYISLRQLPPRLVRVLLVDHTSSYVFHYQGVSVTSDVEMVVFPQLLVRFQRLLVGFSTTDLFGQLRWLDVTRSRIQKLGQKKERTHKHDVLRGLHFFLANPKKRYSCLF